MPQDRHDRVEHGGGPRVALELRTGRCPMWPSSRFFSSLQWVTPLWAVVALIQPVAVLRRRRQAPGCLTWPEGTRGLRRGASLGH